MKRVRKAVNISLSKGVQTAQSLVRKKRLKKAGLPPGSLVFTGHQKIERAEVRVIKYNGTEINELSFDPDRIQKTDEGSTIWFDVRGLHEIDLIEKFGPALDIHPLVLEDVLEVTQRPKFEEYPSGYFLILRDIKFDVEGLRMIPEQIAVYTGHDFVLSFQEDADDLFEEIRNRLLAHRGRIRSRGADYLTYALIDRIVDNYFLVLDQIGDAIEAMEEEIMYDVESSTKGKIHRFKRSLLSMRRAIGPLREAISSLIKAEIPHRDETTDMFLRDAYDHVVQALEILETYRDTLSGLQDLYISELSFKMNSVMQVLTIMATIFIPLTFLAGIYGMNFANMPELQWKYGYFILLGIMAVTAIALILFFRKRKWL